MMKYGMMIVVAVFMTGSVMAQDSAKLKVLENKVVTLEKRLAALEAIVSPVAEKVTVDQVVSRQQKKAKERMRKDLKIYSQAELREIESLYQVANSKWRTQQGKESLELLVKKFDRANRTGCAILYLAQMNNGEEREEYLEEAIDDFGDCYYGNGVQVGAYARFLLAYHYSEAGEEDDAEELLEEIKEDYPDAVSHKGELLVDLIEGD